MNPNTMQRVARLRAMVGRLKSDPDVHAESVDVALVGLEQVLTRLRVEYWKQRGMRETPWWPAPDPNSGWAVVRNPAEPWFVWRVTRDGRYFDDYHNQMNALAAVSFQIANP